MIADGGFAAPPPLCLITRQSEVNQLQHWFKYDI